VRGLGDGFRVCRISDRLRTRRGANKKQRDINQWCESNEEMITSPVCVR
jgi:hypothetical protein